MKFESELKAGRKQFFFSETDDFPLYREHLYNHALKVINFLSKNKESKVLEVGPSHSLYTESFTNFDSCVIRDYCKTNGVYYKTLDIDPSSNCDYICSLENLSKIEEKFDVIIMLGIIEHVRKVWKIPEQLKNIINYSGKLFINTPYMLKEHGPTPDCWRFSKDGLESLFEDCFRLTDIDTFPPNEVDKNSIALSINTVWESSQ